MSNKNVNVESFSFLICFAGNQMMQGGRGFPNNAAAAAASANMRRMNIPQMHSKGTIIFKRKKIM